MHRAEVEYRLDTHALQDFRARLADWFGEHARSLPWRETKDPYAIWLSEIILQQTQVVQGLSYYHRFLELFPNIQALATAHEDEVLRAWQGLGYYSRGRNLLKAARMIVDEFGGQFPNTLQDIQRLPGVGPYTQAAILSFAYNQAYAAVDGNVYRVLSRLYADSTPIDTTQGQKHFRSLAQILLDPEYAGRHNQAMIELGAMVCSPRKPSCLVCPVQPYCQAYATDNPINYPVKQGKVSITHRYLSFFLVQLPENKILIERRDNKDIWQGLYQFPLVETQEASQDISQLFGIESFKDLQSQLQAPIWQALPTASLQHKLTHRVLHAQLYIINAEAYHGTQYQTIAIEDLDEYALPVLLTKLLARIG